MFSKKKSQQADARPVEGPTRMSIRRTLRDRGRDLSWAIVYALYFLVAVGLIISSSIVAKHGNDFFANSSAIMQPMQQGPGAAGGQNAGGNGGGGGGSGGDEEDDQQATGGGGQALNPFTGMPIENMQMFIQETTARNHAVVHAGVISSVGLATGAIVFVLCVASFSAHTFLDRKWKTDPIQKLYPRRVILISVVSVLNIIICGGSAALAAGFAITSDEVRRNIIGTLATTPAYLDASCGMAAITGAMALVTIFVDVRKCKENGREVDRLVGEQEPTRVEKRGTGTSSTPERAERAV